MRHSKIECKYIRYTLDFFQRLHVFQKHFLTPLLGCLRRSQKATISPVKSLLVFQRLPQNRLCSNHLGFQKPSAVEEQKWPKLSVEGKVQLAKGPGTPWAMLGGEYKGTFERKDTIQRDTERSRTYWHTVEDHFRRSPEQKLTGNCLMENQATCKGMNLTCI